MEESKRIRGLGLDDLTTEMGGVQEGSIAWSRYVAEFKRRQARQQDRAAWVAMGSLLVSAVAIVAGSASTIKTSVDVQRSITMPPPSSVCAPAEIEPMRPALSSAQRLALDGATIRVLGEVLAKEYILSDVQHAAWGRRQALRVQHSRDALCLSSAEAEPAG